MRQILIAVDRTTRLVRQLLAMANLDAHQDARRDAIVNLGCAIDEIVDTVPNRDSIRVEIDPALNETLVTANAELLALALRNLHENAIQHSCGPSAVRWRIESRAEAIVVAVEDKGPGIPPDELPLVTRRFFRGRHKSPTGSGLGLSIVELALRANGARLNLVNRSDRSGLRAEIIWPEPAGKSPERADRHDPVLHLAARPS